MNDKSPDEINRDRLQSQEQKDSDSQRIFNRKNADKGELRKEVDSQKVNKENNN